MCTFLCFTAGAWPVMDLHIRLKWICAMRQSLFFSLQMVNTAAREDGSPEGFPFQLLPTHSTMWSPEQAKVTLNARLDACLVPSPASPGGNLAQLPRSLILLSADRQQRVCECRCNVQCLSRHLLLSLHLRYQISTVSVAWQALCMCAAGVRLAYSHVVVLDSFFGEPEREALLSELTQPGWDHSKVDTVNKQPTRLDQKSRRSICCSLLF